MATWGVGIGAKGRVGCSAPSSGGPGAVSGSHAKATATHLEPLQLHLASYACGTSRSQLPSSAGLMTGPKDPAHPRSKLQLTRRGLSAGLCSGGEAPGARRQLLEPRASAMLIVPSHELPPPPTRRRSATRLTPVHAKVLSASPWHAQTRRGSALEQGDQPR